MSRTLLLAGGASPFNPATNGALLEGWDASVTPPGAPGLILSWTGIKGTGARALFPDLDGTHLDDVEVSNAIVPPILSSELEAYAKDS